MALTESLWMVRRSCNQCAVAPAKSDGSMHMRKMIDGLLTLLDAAGVFRSGCGMRQCLHTTMGCDG
jgi:hypothetical protein